ncbi:MAG: hypothetical protein IKI36_08190 [Prevotella sp.]|nr:hypothetical protein [Prevotella sp.]
MAESIYQQEKVNLISSGKYLSAGETDLQGRFKKEGEMLLFYPDFS